MPPTSGVSQRGVLKQQWDEQVRWNTHGGGPWRSGPLARLLVPLGLAAWLAAECQAACNLDAGNWVYKEALPFSRTASSWGFDCSYRSNKTYLNYQWEAPGCKISRLESNADRFLQLLGGKTMLIVGDSLASNLYSALAWSMPRASIGLGPNDRFRDTFKSTVYGSTVKRIWSTYFTREANGRAICHVDKVDPVWSSLTATSRYIVFNGFHHLFHKDVTFYVKGRPVPGMTAIQAVMKVCQRIRRHLQATGYNGTAVFLTYSPGHGGCSRTTQPLTPVQGAIDAASPVDQIIFKVFGYPGSKFQILNVAKLSQLRPDCHSGSGLAFEAPGIAPPDCTHWCIPGLPTTWADILYSRLINAI